jgi:hypothetical protein
MIVLVSGIGVARVRVRVALLRNLGQGGPSGRAADAVRRVDAGRGPGRQPARLFVFWELTSVTSYLLIGVDDTDP